MNTLTIDKEKLQFIQDNFPAMYDQIKATIDYRDLLVKKMELLTEMVKNCEMHEESSKASRLGVHILDMIDTIDRKLQIVQIQSDIASKDNYLHEAIDHATRQKK